MGGGSNENMVVEARLETSVVEYVRLCLSVSCYNCKIQQLCLRPKSVLTIGYYHIPHNTTGRNTNTGGGGEFSLNFNV